MDAFEFEFLWHGVVRRPEKITFPMSREENQKENEPEAAIVRARHLERMPKSKRPRD